MVSAAFEVFGPGLVTKRTKEGPGRPQEANPMSSFSFPFTDLQIPISAVV